MYEYKIEFFPVNSKMKDELSDEFYKYCTFCSKQVLIDHEITQKTPKNIIDGNYLCNFCFRKNVNQNKVIIFSFKSIIVYLHEIYKLNSSDNPFYRSQLNDYVDTHKKTGLKNLALDYDDESFNWFLNIDLIGSEDNQISFRELEKTIIEILTCFNLYFFGIDGYSIYNNLKKMISSSIQNKNSIVNPLYFVPLINKGQSLDKVKVFSNTFGT